MHSSWTLALALSDLNTNGDDVVVATTTQIDPDRPRSTRKPTMRTAGRDEAGLGGGGRDTSDDIRRYARRRDEGAQKRRVHDNHTTLACLRRKGTLKHSQRGYQGRIRWPQEVSCLYPVDRLHEDLLAEQENTKAFQFWQIRP